MYTILDSSERRHRCNTGRSQAAAVADAVRYTQPRTALAEQSSVGERRWYSNCCHSLLAALRERVEVGILVAGWTAAAALRLNYNNRSTAHTTTNNDNQLRPLSLL